MRKSLKFRHFNWDMTKFAKIHPLRVCHQKKTTISTMKMIQPYWSSMAPVLCMQVFD